jgi:hypothetical protein
MPTKLGQRPSASAKVMTDDHSEIDQLINELLATLDNGNQVQSFAQLDLLWARLAVHIRAEHLCLFPSILAASRDHFTGSRGAPQYEDAQGAIDLLQQDHAFFMRELAAAVNAMRKDETVSDPALISTGLREVRRCVDTVKTRLHTHNQLEEEKVYGWVGVLLDEPERSALASRMRHELENIPPRFNPV